MTDKPRIAAIMQARMGSSRLPGKIVTDIAGRPMLNVIIDRLRRSKLMDELVIASSELPANQVVEEIAGRAGVRCYRGSEDDVLGVGRIWRPDGRADHRTKPGRIGESHRRGGIGHQSWLAE